MALNFRCKRHANSFREEKSNAGVASPSLALTARQHFHCNNTGPVHGYGKLNGALLEKGIQINSNILNFKRSSGGSAVLMGKVFLNM